MWLFSLYLLLCFPFGVYNVHAVDNDYSVVRVVSWDWLEGLVPFWLKDSLKPAGERVHPQTA